MNTLAQHRQCARKPDCLPAAAPSTTPHGAVVSETGAAVQVFQARLLPGNDNQEKEE